MSESLAPGSIFAGCCVEAVAGRGGMGVVLRATQLALQRPVAMKVITPELAADHGYRERFERESHLAASVEHPNVIPVYEAGELDGRLYLIMRWVEGTDLRTLLSNSGRLSPGRAISLLRPVASALAAAHRHGLVHRDIKPANVLIARGDEEDEEHVYLTDFGIARRTDGESMTRTGMLVGTIDYMAPERFEGGKGEAASDIYSFGCMLFEALIGHVPYQRPNDIAKIFAHVNDPIPSARDEVDDVPDQLDAIIAKALAKRPEDRLASATELAVALGQARQELDTAERAATMPKARPEMAERPTPTPTATGPAAAMTEPTAATETTSGAAEPTAVTGPVTDATQPNRTPEPLRTVSATVPLTSAPTRHTAEQQAPRVARRRAWRWVVPIALLAMAGILVAVLTGDPSHPNSGKAPSETADTASAEIKIHGNGLREGRTIALPSAAGSISMGSRNLWISLPGSAQLLRFNPLTGDQRGFPASGRPTAITAGSSALWVADTRARSLAQFNGDSGAREASTRLPGTPTAVAVDQKDSSAWVADSSGTISHVALGGTMIGTPAHITPAATSLAWGEGWLWATNGADHGLIRVGLGTTGSSTAYATGPRPIAVTLNQGVWTAHADGHVTRFDPRSDHLRVNANIRIADELHAIAATEQSPFVWAISRGSMTLYRITNTDNPAVTGTVVFASPPIALAAAPHLVWVATQDAKVIQIRF